MGCMNDKTFTLHGRHLSIESLRFESDITVDFDCR